MVTAGSQVKLEKWQRPFFTIWVGQALSLLGTQLVQFALIWWLTQSTGSATVLATASLVGLVPNVLLSPIAGALVDRWNRKATMIVADGLTALATLVLALLFMSGVVQYWHVYLLLFVRSVTGSFHWPAMQASTSLMVPKEHLSRIQGINQMLNGGMSIFSAPLGALLIQVLPMFGVLAIDIVTAALAITTLFIVAIPQPEKKLATQDGQAETSVWQDFRSGLKYAFSWPGLVIIGAMATLINFLLTPGFSLMPILVLKHFYGQAFQLAWIESAMGIGTILGGLLLSVWGGFRRRILTSLAGLIVAGISLMVAGLAPSWGITIAIGAFFITGFSLPMVNGPLMAVVQATVAPEMQGRIFTIIGSVSAAMSPLGLIIAGPVSDAFGANAWFVVGGIFTALMGAIGFFIPSVITIEEGYKPRPGKAGEKVASAEIVPQPGQSGDD